MNDDFPHPIPMPPPAMIQLPSPPHEVTDGVAALRVACAKWAPSPGASDHKSELQACDTVLNRNTDLPVGIIIGVGGALAGVAFVSMCRAMVRGRAFSRIEDVAAYVGCAVLALPVWLITSVITKHWCEDWTDDRRGAVIVGCTIGFATFLALTRWVVPGPGSEGDGMRRIAIVLSPLLVFSACAVPPPGPTIAVIPAHGKSFETFRSEQEQCKEYAAREVAGIGDHANTMQAILGIGGALLGAGVGGAVGGGKGALIGGGLGAAGGAGAGGVSASHTGDAMQDRYNVAYAECNVAHHNLVPGLGYQGAAR